MNEQIQKLRKIIEQDGSLTPEQRIALEKAVSEAEKEFSIISFKLERTEKVKRTTSILLEETIQELEQKRKAIEEKNRELEIESALEKVRTAAMAMKSRSDMISICRIIMEQLENLKVTGIRNVQTAIIDETKRIYLNYEYYRNPEQEVVTEIPYDLHPVQQEFALKMLRGAGEVYEHRFKGDEIREWIRNQERTGEYVDPNLHTADILEYHWYSLGPVAMGISAYRHLDKEEIALFIRFKNVFELAYRRYLDIEKAEEQAREAQIELALERVRARTMSMQRSDELPEAANNLFLQVQSLGIPAWSAGYCIWEEDKKAAACFMSSEGVIQKGFRFPSEGEGYNFYEPWEKGESFYVLELGGEALARHYEYMRTLPIVGELLDSIIAAGFPIPTYQVFHIVYFSYGYLMFITYEPMPDAHPVFKRFASVFEQTYTRFLDLQKAEAQAFEARVEAALEKVRSRAMAMQKSDELQELITTVYGELTKLDVVLERCFIAIFDQETRSSTWWMAAPEIPSGVRGLTMQYHESPPYLAYLQAWEERQVKWQYALEGNTKKAWDDFIFIQTEFSQLPTQVIEFMKEKKLVYLNGSFNAFGCLSLATVDPLSDDQFDIMNRFSRVIDLGYTRFNDLKQAEAQAREATIQLALERVRARTMAMQHSEELLEVIKVVSEQLKALNFKFESASFVVTSNLNEYEFWLSYSNDQLPIRITVPYIDNPIFNSAIEAAKKGLDFLADELAYDEKNAWFRHLFEHSVFKNIPDERKEDLLKTKGMARSIAFMNDIAMVISNYDLLPYTDEENRILKRFAKVFEQAHTRFNDLKLAELRAKEAEIEASLERVRSRAMAMHSSKDLAETIAAFYHELELFSITPRRCGVGLLNKETRIAELSTMNTTEEGKSIEVIGQIKMSGHPVLEGVYNNWLKQEEYHPVLRGPEIKEYYKLVRPQIEFPDYPNDTVQYGYFFFFPEGGVYAWTEKELEEDELKLYRRFTSVLSLTYKRYKDLQQAEALALQAEQDLILLKEEKKRTEEALAELKETQKQLIHSEKMASLGELTAGIAHEIQNPLNFVNNFSEVSNELLDEMINELEHQNTKDAVAIAGDVKQNLEKILHHGKRADGIVKGMLLHSRSSSGQRESIDMNALADEYLRLSYHGLRAKDKSFNAKFITHFDERLSRVNVITQDMGRVILNLINNAFYAVSQRKKFNEKEYEPTVILTTTELGDKVEIRVKDNGTGIPGKVLDKIFQPFFTTKPTGEGTGLGLSLSYDIIRAHGGELKVETREGEGSEFIIQLPVQ